MRLTPSLIALSLLALPFSAATGQDRMAGCGESVTLESGDTLGGIAQRCGTTVDAIRAANPDLGDPRRLRVGTVVRLPDGAGPAPTTRREGEAAETGTPRDYVIRQGDSWETIAEETGTSVDALMNANPEIASIALNVGSTLRVPRRSQVEGDAPMLPSGPAGTPSAESGAASSKMRDIGGDATAEAGLRVVGTLTSEGVECPTLRSLDGTLYTLAGSIDPFKDGDQVVVTGRRAEQSTCMQGTTINVEKIAPAS